PLTSGFCFLLPFGYGLYRIPDEVKGERVRVSVIQPNIIPSLKWTPIGPQESLKILKEMTRGAIASEHPDLVVWPETAIPSYIRIRPVYRNDLHHFVDSLNIPLLTGAPDYEVETGKTFNSVFLFRPGRHDLQKYDKMNLVPIGERIPFSDLFPIQKKIPVPDVGETGFERGTTMTLFEHNGQKFATLICFESIFPDLVRAFVRDGADFLINITNDGWFGKTSGPYQHAQIAIFRAIENRIGIARCANTGVSMFIDPYGRTIRPTGIFHPSTLTERVNLRSETTFFTRYGNVFAMICTLIAGGIVATSARRKKPVAHKPLPIFLIVVLSPLLSISASAGEWTAYTNMKQVNALLPLDGEVWAETAGGVFRFTFADSAYTTYTTLDGLPDNNVLSAARDEEGTIWFGTEQGGISRYVPRLKKFLPPLTDFEKIRVNALHFYNNRLFVGTQDGISLLEPVPGRPGQWQTKETYDALNRLPKGTEVFALKVFRGILWAGTKAGMVQADLTRPNLNLLDPMSWHVFSSLGTVTQIVQKDSILFAATSRGVFRLERASLWVFDGISTAQGLSADSVAVYTGNQRSIYQRVEGRWQPIINLSSDIATLDVDPKSDLWVGTKGDGMKRISEGREIPLPPLGGPFDNRFTGIAVDREGGIWVVSERNDKETRTSDTGVMHFDGKAWQSFSAKNGLPPNHPVAVTVDREGKPWMGTWGGGIGVRNTNGQWITLNRRNSVLQPSDVGGNYVVVNDFLIDRAGNIWMSNFTPPPDKAGLAVMNGFPVTKSILYTSSTDRLPSAYGAAIAIDKDDLKWVGTFDAGFFLFDDGGTPFTRGDDHVVFFSTASSDEKNELTSDKISDIDVDPSGTVWVATDQGLNMMKGSYSRTSGTYTITEWRVYTSSQGLPSDTITELLVDPSGVIWVGTDGGLAQILPDGRVGSVFTQSNSGLIDNDVQALAFREQTGELVIGTMRGMSLFRIRISSDGDETSGISIFPNPLPPGVAFVTFSGLTTGDLVRIFSVAGELVKVFPPERISGGRITWDRTNESGFLVGSGVYYVSVMSGTGPARTGKLAVINE
ncbi:MAG: apolipoprotein N-acyltransferase, partial [Candidatus Latescibacteria bacterium]|nr:apolipoprotein N-acyltransferase [Candidatus Latescibacterota bacterium]